MLDLDLTTDIEPYRFKLTVLIMAIGARSDGRKARVHTEGGWSPEMGRPAAGGSAVDVATAPVVFQARGRVVGVQGDEAELVARRGRCPRPGAVGRRGRSGAGRRPDSVELALGEQLCKKIVKDVSEVRNREGSRGDQVLVAWADCGGRI